MTTEIERYGRAAAALLAESERIFKAAGDSDRPDLTITSAQVLAQQAQAYATLTLAKTYVQDKWWATHDA